MPGLNNTAFAKLVGVNEGVIRRAIKAGRIIVSADGTIDPETQVSRWNDTRDLKRVHDGLPADPDHPRRKGRPKTATTATAQSQARKAYDEKLDLEGQELALRVELLSEKLKRERAESVDREATRRALAAFSRLVRDKWVNFGNRYGQQIAAAINAEPKLVMAELDKAVRLQLDEIANARATLPE